MVTVFSNIICAENTAEKIKEEEIKNFITDKYNIFKLGAISYDLLYFYDAFSKTENTWVRNLANIIKNCGVKYFDIAKKYISKADKKDKPILTAYVLGCGVHYLVKYRTNPYLSYLTNDITDRIKLNEISVKTDSCLCGLLNKDIAKLSQFTNVSEDEIKVIEGLYRYMISELKKEIIPEGLISDCKNKLAKALTQKKSILPHPGKEFVYKAMPDDSDILNEKHAVWSEPAKDTEKNNFSYTQILSYAQKDSIRAIPKLYTALSSNASQSCEFIFRNYK